MTAVGQARLAGLRRALGLVLIGGLCAAAVTFYREGPAAISPLAAGVPKGLPVVMIVGGSTVLNVQCPARRRISEQACSIGRAPELQVKGTLPWRSTVIVVQFDLPRPQ
jgi:hypothetical protein